MADIKQVNGSMLAYAIDKTLSLLDEKADVADLEIIQNGAAKLVDLTGQVQLSSYRKSVIALCNTSAADTYVDSYSVGTMYAHRYDGNQAMLTADVAIEAKYSSEYGITASVLDSLSDGFYIRPCTFVYNGVTYGGVELVTASDQYDCVKFFGETNFGIFGLDYYNTNDNVALNDEVADSISYSSVAYNGTLRWNTYEVYHAGNKPTLADLGLTATATELNYTTGTTENIQAQLDNKASANYATADDIVALF